VDDIGGDGIVMPLPEPHVDEGVGALDGIPSTAVGIERRPVTVVGAKSHSAASIVVVCRNTVSRKDRSEAVISSRSTCNSMQLHSPGLIHPCGWHCAVRPSV